MALVGLIVTTTNNPICEKKTIFRIFCIFSNNVGKKYSLEFYSLKASIIFSSSILLNKYFVNTIFFLNLFI